MYRTTVFLAMAVAVSTAQAAPTPEEMWQIIQQQQQQIEALKGRLEQTDTKLEQTEIKVEATADAVDSGAAVGSPVAAWANKTTIGGYGEHHFNHFEDKDDMVDAHRFVFFLGHQFSDTVRLFSEVELEHGLVEGGEDKGEVELEQAYIEWDFARQHRLQIGQFLLPVGLINETHEPNSFYGVERNKVEAEIIPATWWETGVKVTGEIAPGFSYDAAVHSGLNTESGQSIRSGRQHSSKAKAEDMAFTGRLKYTGIAGLELAGSYQWQQDVAQGESGDASNEATLLTAHAKYQAGPLTLIALWAGWDIDGDTFELAGADKQAGWYAEASYKITEKLGVFVRQSQWDTRAGNSADTEEEQIDVGLNYWLHEQVVLKADYSDDRTSNAPDNDAINFGVGWSF